MHVNRYLILALEEIRDLKEAPYEFPSDWHEQIEACPECQRYKGHPIQQGICDKHRKPLYERNAHERHELEALGFRAKHIAREALYSVRPDAVGGKPPQGALQARTDHGQVLAVGEPCAGEWKPDFYGEINWSCRCGAIHPDNCITETANDHAIGRA